MRLFLESQGYHVRSVATGASGIQSAKEDPPAVCLVDLVLPDMDGFLLTRSIRDLPGCDSVRFIMLTAMGTLREAREFVGKHVTPADAFMEKPVDFHALKDMIVSLCSGT